MSKIERRKFIQLSAAAAVGCIMQPVRKAEAQGQPQLSLDDPMAKAMKYVHDSSIPEKTCANCALIQGNDGDEWRPCQIFPGKLVSANGWCSVWAPKA